MCMVSTKKYNVIPLRRCAAPNTSTREKNGQKMRFFENYRKTAGRRMLAIINSITSEKYLSNGVSLTFQLLAVGENDGHTYFFVTN